MPALRSKYRNDPRFSTGGAVPAPDDAIAPEPAADASALQAQIAAMEQVIASDESALAARQEAAQLRLENEAMRQVAADPIEQTIVNSGLPPLAQDWLRVNSEYLSDPEKNERLQALHHEVVNEGLEPYSASYYDRLDQRLAAPEEEYVRGSNGSLRVTEGTIGSALRTARALAKEDADDDAPVRRRPVVSAPPSREVPGSHSGPNYDPARGKVTLTAAEREAALISGVTPEIYALNKLRLLREKEAGNYHGRP